MIIDKLKLASRVGYLRLFGKRSNICSDYDVAAETYDSYYSRNLIHASQPYIDKVPVSKGMVIADLACGTGFFSHILAARIGSSGKVTAVDISSGMLAQAEKQAQDKQLNNVEYLQGDAIDYLKQQADASLDLINIGWGICYMNHQILLTEVMRTLRPGGYLSIIENKDNTLYEISKHFEQVLTKHPHALQKHMDIKLPRNSKYLKKVFIGNRKLKLLECYDGSVEVPCKNGAEVSEYMVRSGASSGFMDALAPDQINDVITTFIKQADENAQNGKGLPKVVHQFAVLIGQKKR